MIKIVNIKQTCYACPSQWEGLDEDGKEVYIRFRHGTLRLDINNETIFSFEHPELDGVIEFDEVLDICKDHICMNENAKEEHMSDPNEDYPYTEPNF